MKHTYLNFQRMPITEGSFTQEEFDAAVTANPELLKQVTPVLTKLEYVVRDKAAEETFRTNLAQQTTNDLTKLHATSIEKDVLETTGIAKEKEDEKYFEYQKRVLRTLKEKAEKAETELEAARKAGGSSQADKLRIKELEDGLKKKSDEWEAEKTKLSGEAFSAKVGGKMDAAFASKRATYLETIPEELISDKEGIAKDKLMKIAKVNEKGDLVFYEGDKLLTDPVTLLPRTLDEMVTEEMKSCIDTGKTATGTGSTKTKDAPAGEKKWTGMPAEVKSKVQLHEYLNKLGYVDGAEDFNKLYEEHSKNLPLNV